MRVTRRCSRPRANTETSRWGASTPPSGAGRGPGLTVTIAQRPWASVGQRPNPRNPDPDAPGDHPGGPPDPPDPPGDHPGGPPDPPGPGPRGSSGWAKRPWGSACQVSTRASGTGSPAPSVTVPATRM